MHLSSAAYLAALGAVRSTAELRELVSAMGASPRLRWTQTYADGVLGSALAVAGALGIGGDGRVVQELRVGQVCGVRRVDIVRALPVWQVPERRQVLRVRRVRGWLLDVWCDHGADGVHCDPDAVADPVPDG